MKNSKKKNNQAPCLENELLLHLLWLDTCCWDGGMVAHALLLKDIPSVR